MSTTSKMNPAAKEFVPAHILKKRQEEEAKRLGELTEQLDKVDLSNATSATSNNKDNKDNENNLNDDNKNAGNAALEGGDSKDIRDTNNDDVNNEANVDNSSSSSKNNINGNPHQEKSNIKSHQHDNIKSTIDGNYNGKNKQYPKHNNGDHANEYPEGFHEFVEQDEEDRYLLHAGENLCEFNGEQFIIPGDDEYEPPTQAGYDFGNAEDNEDEDVCNAFEEFLGNLPNQ